MIWLRGIWLATIGVFLACSVSIGQSDAPKWVDTSGPVPADAIIIFDGKTTKNLVGPKGEPCTWPVKDGALICNTKNQSRQQGLWTKLHFCDAQIHVEYLVPESDRKGEGAGNSGLYIHGLFEHQILNSYKNKSRPKSLNGAIYSISPPLVNASRPPGNWQVYDIIYHAPKRNDKGEPIAPGHITTMLNGVLVQYHVPITKRVSIYTPLYFRTTPYSDRIRQSLLKTGCGPLQLQDHDNPVQFRNIWIRPLDDKAFVFE